MQLNYEIIFYDSFGASAYLKFFAKNDVEASSHASSLITDAQKDIGSSEPNFMWSQPLNENADIHAQYRSTSQPDLPWRIVNKPQ